MIDEQEFLRAWEAVNTAREQGEIAVSPSLNRLLNIAPRPVEELIRTRAQRDQARAAAGTPFLEPKRNHRRSNS